MFFSYVFVALHAIFIFQFGKIVIFKLNYLLNFVMNLHSTVGYVTNLHLSVDS